MTGRSPAELNGLAPQDLVGLMRRNLAVARTALFAAHRPASPAAAAGQGAGR